MTGRSSGKCYDEGLVVGEDSNGGIRVRILESREAQTHLWGLARAPFSKKFKKLQLVGDFVPQTLYRGFAS